jgi:hypothetical protein
MIPVDPSEKDRELKLAEPEQPVTTEGVVEQGLPGINRDNTHNDNM